MKFNRMIAGIGAVSIFTVLQFTSPGLAQEQTADLGTQVWKAAHQGDQNKTLQLVKKISSEKDSAKAMKLKEEYSLFQKHAIDRQKRAEDAYKASIAEAEKFLGEEKYIEAMNALIKAIDDINDRDKVMGLDLTKKILDESIKAAEAAEKKGDLLEATTLYSRLSFLYQNEQRYVDGLKRVARHLRLMRMYAPKAMYQLYVDRAKARNEADPAPFNGQTELWKKDVRENQPTMLRESLARAVRLHVEGASYRKLLKGGIEAMEVMLNTNGLDGTFKGLGDAAKVKAFRDHMAEMNKDLDKPGMKMTYSQVSDMIDGLMAVNQATIQLPEEVLMHEFGDGCMGVLDDYSTIIWPAQVDYFKRTMEGSFSGVGIQIQMKDGEITIISPLKGTPAHEAGIKAQERIVEIDGSSAAGMTLDQAVEQITGKSGTKVTLGIKDIHGKVRQVPLIRRSIKLVSVKGWERKSDGTWDFYIDEDAKVGYIRVTSFGKNTVSEMDAAIQAMKNDKGINGLILDLRFNPGGLLTAAINMSDRFIERGVIVSGQGPIPEKAFVAPADPRKTTADFPLVVLINSGSASASEIVSGALQDHGRALIVGENSFGKGSVQELFPVSIGRAYLKLTTQYYKLPKGRIIHRRPGAKTWGIHPDYEVALSQGETEKMVAARSHLDVLRNPNDADTLEKPSTQPSSAEEKLEWDLRHPKTADEFLKNGLDPQLETAVLLLKARLLGESKAKTAEARAEN